MLVITTLTHKQENDISCSMVGMDFIPKLYSLEPY